MSKLTEIKQAYEILQKGVEAIPDYKVLGVVVLTDINYLISLLEEKDKALAFYADEDNYTIGNYTRIENDMVYDWESKVQQDFGTRAKAALTASNNEGVK
jgi:hypothetical protein